MGERELAGPVSEAKCVLMFEALSEKVDTHQNETRTYRKEMQGYQRELYTHQSQTRYALQQLASTFATPHHPGLGGIPPHYPTGYWHPPAPAPPFAPQPYYYHPLFQPQPCPPPGPPLAGSRLVAYPSPTTAVPPDRFLHPTWSDNPQPRFEELQPPSEGCKSSRPIPPPPIPGVFIENVGRKPGGWRRAVDQWEQPNPKNGLPALRDWPESWYKGEMSQYTATLRLGRERIASEYNRLSRDDAMFVETYPEANGSLSSLLKAIQKKVGVNRRVSRNGTPAQR